MWSLRTANSALVQRTLGDHSRSRPSHGGSRLSPVDLHRGGGRGLDERLTNAECTLGKATGPLTYPSAPRPAFVSCCLL